MVFSLFSIGFLSVLQKTIKILQAGHKNCSIKKVYLIIGLLLFEMCVKKHTL